MGKTGNLASPRWRRLPVGSRNVVVLVLWRRCITSALTEICVSSCSACAFQQKTGRTGIEQISYVYGNQVYISIHG